MGDTENAVWEAQVKQQLVETKKVELIERVETHDHLREVKTYEKMIRKQEMQDERDLKQALEMDYQQRQLLQEKEALLQSLEFSRRCQGSQIRSSRGSSYSRRIWIEANCITRPTWRGHRSPVSQSPG